MLKSSRFVSLALAGVLAFGLSAMAGDVEAKSDKDKAAAPAQVEMSKAAADAIKAAFPNATVGKVRQAGKDDAKMYTVMLSEGKKSSHTVTVTDAGVIVLVSTPVAADALPKDVSAAAAGAVDGAKVAGATRKESRVDGKMATLDKPVVTYEIALVKDDTKGSIVIAEDGKIVQPAKMREQKPKDEGKERTEKKDK